MTSQWSGQYLPNTTVQESGELLYWLSPLSRSQQSGQVPLPDDIDSDNEVDSESKEDIPATFTMKPIVANLNDPDCNNSTKNNGEWVINDNVAFDYSLCLDDVFNSVNLAPYICPYLQ